jgi:hypothetical protein
VSLPQCASAPPQPSKPVNHDVRFWPAEAKEMISILDDAFSPMSDRRQARRVRYRVRATMHVGEERETAYTRDINRWNLGLICQRPLEVGHAVELELHDPQGQETRVPCVVRRCRQLKAGWYEACLHFVREEPRFHLL